MSALSERAAAMADKARAKAQRTAPERLDVAREWWRITRPGTPAFDVFLCPAQTAGEVRGLYPGCSAEELAA